MAQRLATTGIVSFFFLINGAFEALEFLACVK
jgi:hypothetical protein